MKRHSTVPKRKTKSIRKRSRKQGQGPMKRSDEFEHPRAVWKFIIWPPPLLLVAPLLPAAFPNTVCTVRAKAMPTTMIIQCLQLMGSCPSLFSAA
ncbi:hypothetical protein V6N13_143798 [Hibiscus sabdariffa]|uniref:Uncharacterized protein n=1 Tax=Hibiscus sabdariffa TaxID=183260 RepID=A0ABR2FIG5_9ROSI